ncbi:MAG TPA: dihydrodipicolinate synthase family protein [Bryobacteraceae bacterium]|nr:dihydrodipicolinate synthase family protein [Bryobacteraceae bacterium]
MNGLQGVNAAAITPRGKQGEIDLGAAFELIDHLCAAGVRGIVLFSDYGEYPAFTAEERSRLAYLAVKRSRVPVLVGVGSPTMDLSVCLAREARDAGAAGLLLPPPFFYRYDADDLLEFYKRFAFQLGSRDEAYLSNTPDSTSPVPLETALELLRTGLYAGVEDSSGSFEAFSCLQAAAESCAFQLLVGSDAIFTRTRCAGASNVNGIHRAGAVSAAACAVPELILALDRAIGSGRAEETQTLDSHLGQFLEWEARFPRPMIVKVATGLRGLKTGPIPVPLSPGKERLLGQFREWFQGWLPAVKKMAAKA